MHEVIQLILNFLYNKNMFLSMKVHVHWVKLVKNEIIQKFQSLEILKKKAIKQGLFFKTIFQWVQNV